MPKLPKGMFRRKGRPGWYVRVHRGGREKWVFKKAEEKAKAVHRGESPLGSCRLTVGEAADRWVESYVRTQRTGNRPEARRSKGP